jgi:hypothetical protein
METTLCNLLSSRKQIDALKQEHQSIRLAYEAKFIEQNEQINYLQEENYRLKYSSQNNQQPQCTKCDENSVDWRMVDNVMRQLLNSLKIQETIRTEYSKLLTDKSLTNISLRLDNDNDNSNSANYSKTMELENDNHRDCKYSQYINNKKQVYTNLITLKRGIQQLYKQISRFIGTTAATTVEFT